MKWLAAIAAIFLSVGAVPANAQDQQVLRNGAPFAVDPASAYLLVRLMVPKGADRYDFVLLRELTRAERDGYEAARAAALAKAKNPERFKFAYEGASNVARVPATERYAEDGETAIYLLRVRPGSYLVAGPAGIRGGVPIHCLCMGSVKFEAKAGEITDLGYLLTARIDRPTTIPELQPLVGRAKQRTHFVFQFASGVRPYREGMPVPDAVKGKPHVAADYRAVGKLPNLFGLQVSRLAPLPGVLAYDEDRVIDVKAAASGQVLTP
jgi:hypothetical protein